MKQAAVISPVIEPNGRLRCSRQDETEKPSIHWNMSGFVCWWTYTLIVSGTFSTSLIFSSGKHETCYKQCRNLSTHICCAGARPIVYSLLILCNTIFFSWRAEIASICSMRASVGSGLDVFFGTPRTRFKPQARLSTAVAKLCRDIDPTKKGLPHVAI